MAWWDQRGKCLKWICSSWFCRPFSRQTRPWLGRLLPRRGPCCRVSGHYGTQAWWGTRYVRCRSSWRPASSFASHQPTANQETRAVVSLWNLSVPNNNFHAAFLFPRVILQREVSETFLRCIPLGALVLTYSFETLSVNRHLFDDITHMSTSVDTS